MTKTYIALLRGINVGGNKKIAMAELRDLLAELGFTNVRSVLQSGNVVFDATAGTPAKLEKQLGDATEKQLGVATEYFIRSAVEWRTIVANNPFTSEAKRDPSHMLVMVFRDKLDNKAVAGLRDAIVGNESVIADERQLYMVYPDGIGTSKLTNTVIEKKLSARGTARNWNTVLKLADLVA